MSQRIELSWFLILFTLGIVLLYSYYYLINKNKKIANDLWGNILNIKHLIPVYIGSMFLTAVGFLCVLYYLYKTSSLTLYEKKIIPIALMVIIIVSILWMPLSLNYLKSKTKPAYLKYIIIAVLSIVAFASLYSTVLINNIREKNYKLEQKIATIGMSYFFIHTFFLDNLTWSYNFFF